jgi:methylglyoxal synthase
VSSLFPVIALIAHDAKKDDLVAFALRHREMLGRFQLIATGTTGLRIQEATQLKVERLLSGPLGGDLQIGARIAVGEIRMVIFLRDPLTAHAHEPDISALMKICDVHNVAIATNLSGAEILVRSLGENV